MRKITMAAAGMVSMLASVTTAGAATVTNVTFDAGHTVGQQFNAATGTNSIPLANGDATKLTDITDFGDSADSYTATVTAANGVFTSQFLQYDIAALTRLTGRIESFNPGLYSGLGNATYFVQLDFARFSDGGATAIWPMSLVNTSGTSLGSAYSFYDGSLTGEFTPFNVNQVYTLRLEYDVAEGSDTAVRYYVNGVLKSSSTSSVTGPVGGLSIVTGAGDVSGVDRSFGIDNLQTGTVSAAVPEPTSLGLITAAGMLVLRRRR